MRDLEFSDDLKSALDDPSRKVPAGTPRGKPRHGWSRAHAEYQERSHDLAEQFTRLAKDNGIDLTKVEGNSAREIADQLIEQVDRDPYLSRFNELVDEGADYKQLNRMLDDFSPDILRTRAGIHAPTLKSGRGAARVIAKSALKKLGPAAAAGFFFADIASGSSANDAAYNLFMSSTGGDLVQYSIEENILTKTGQKSSL